MKKLDARINHGRWIVDCPDCKGAEVPERMLKKDIFICDECFPGATQGAPEDRGAASAKAYKLDMAYKIKYPPNKSKIEDVLRKRPKPNMNWLPGETVEDLERENEAHGVK
jgi:hypothetical protein